MTPTGSSKAAMIVGATSGIGRAVARRWGAAGYALILAGRDLAELDRDAADLRIRYSVDVATARFDAQAFQDHAAFVDAAVARFSTADDPKQNALDALIFCHGVMPAQVAAQGDFALARQTIDGNYTAAVSVLELAARYFVARGRGTICAIGSVAGDRGRQSNYLYGSAKAALATYTLGLRHRLARHGVKVITIKPGFVDTGMTWGLPGLFLVASPDRVARAIFRACRRNRAVAYVPWFWRYIMLIIRSVPDLVFKRTKL